MSFDHTMSGTHLWFFFIFIFGGSLTKLEIFLCTVVLFLVKYEENDNLLPIKKHGYFTVGPEN